MPIRVNLNWADEDDDLTVDQTVTNVSLGGLAFLSDRPLEKLARVRICITILDQDNFLVGNVVWCNPIGSGYEIGVEFERSRDVYRLRMIEQICHIEHYRKEVERVEGRQLSPQDAAKEWIARYAGDFPAF